MSAKKRILFVDDEPVRDSVRRLVRPFQAEWDLAFAGTAEEVLSALDTVGADAVVTGLSIPGLEGASLLEAIAVRVPEAVRIVLAPSADQRKVMECASLAHQFITRPCEAEVLHEAISRGFEMESSVRRDRIRALVERMDHMPSLPDLYIQLAEKVQDPECEIEDLGALIARDISMTARILKLVNSAAFGLRRRVSSAQEAVNYVGIDTVKALVLSVSAFAQFENRELGGFSLEALWSHSLLTAGCAKVIALSERARASLVDAAFVAGMLHDIGKLALGANFGETYAEVVAEAEDVSGGLLAAETATFGADHAEIGGQLLALWGLPNNVVDAVLWHHHPSGCGDTSFSPLACVHAANVWAHEGEASEWLKMADDYYATLELSHRLPVWHEAFNDTSSTAVGS